jgi:hypothetical protein
MTLPPLLDLHPLPETPEALARECKCARAGKTRDGKPLYRFEKGCPIPNHN